MSTNKITAKPGKVFFQPTRRVGRRKNLGAMSWQEGHMVVCIGYSEDGLTVAYATPEQIDAIKRSVRRQRKSPLYRLLMHIISHYERRAG